MDDCHIYFVCDCSQVHLDKVLDDDAPFDICSCQVGDFFILNLSIMSEPYDTHILK